MGASRTQELGILQTHPDTSHHSCGSSRNTRTVGVGLCLTHSTAHLAARTPTLAATAMLSAAQRG